MKRYIAFLAAALTLFACQPQQPDGSKYAPAPKLPVSTATVEFDCDGGYGYVGVTTQEAIEASSNREWLTVSTSSYGVNLSVTENETIETRYAIITVKSGNLSANVQVVQFGVNTKYFWKDEYSFPYGGGTLELLYKTDETVKIIVEGSEWIEAIPDNGVLTINVAQNPLKQIREGFITYMAGEDVRSFAVIQALNPSGGGDDPTGPVIFSEDFEDEATLADWLFADVDGDGYNWSYTTQLAAHSGAGVLISASYVNSVGALTPDNWAITPAIGLSTDNYVSFWVTAQDPDWNEEHYGVYIATEAPQTYGDLDKFEMLFEATNPVSDPYNEEVIPFDSTDGEVDMVWQQIAVKIPAAYENKTVYFAFRHFNCSDMFILNIDDVMVSKGAPEKTSATSSVSSIRPTKAEGNSIYYFKRK